MADLIPLKWETVQKKISELIPCDFNPRKATEQKLKKLQQSIEKFNIVEIPTIDFDEILLSYHQRIKVLFILGRGEELIDCRKPNRKLTDEEFKELMLQLNIHAGDFDFSDVEEYFQEIDLESIGLEPLEIGNIEDAPTILPDPKEVKTQNEILKEIKEMEVKPYERTHVLLSFPPEKIIQIKSLLEEILKFDFIEYEQSSN